MNARATSRIVRLVRLMRPGHNPLARGVDRLQGALVALSLAVGLVLVPVMLTIGSLTYADLSEQGDEQARTRYETVATLTRDAPNAAMGAHGDIGVGSSKVPGEWRLRDGTTRAGRVTADDGLRTGAKVTVWLDEEDQPTEPPVSAPEAVMAGVLVAATGWLTIAGFLALFCCGVHWLLERHRVRGWQKEWALVEPAWRDQHR